MEAMKIDMVRFMAGQVVPGEKLFGNIACHLPDIRALRAYLDCHLSQGWEVTVLLRGNEHEVSRVDGRAGRMRRTNGVKVVTNAAQACYQRCHGG
ncbi:hypothetical protein D3C77_298520 [compost metagenome]